MKIDLPLRPRRLRRSVALRALIKETQLTTNDVIYPLFIKEGIQDRVALSTMPGVCQLPLHLLEEEIQSIVDLKIPGVILFGIPEHKDEQGGHSLSDDNIIQQAIRVIKNIAPQLLIIADVCLCEYTSHGHCGILRDREVDNDSTLEILANQAISFAKAGADILAPSGMMDGMVSAIRHGLDSNGYQDLPILSYAVKYASCFYGPFREAAEGAPSFGDRTQYQMDPANQSEAIKEAQLDIEEGADMLMVKPAQNYLDVIYRLKQQFNEYPLAAYQVSGEYALIKHGAKIGLVDEYSAMIESVTAIKRAGADFVITYFAKEINKRLLSRSISPS